MSDDALLSLDRARMLPEGTRERALAEFAMRLRWHWIFDPCPRVLALSPPDGGDVFQRFSAWSDEAKLSMDWSLHLRLLEWLLHDERHRAAASDDMIIELLAASASKWAIFDRGPSKGIVLGCQRLATSVVAAWKCLSPGKGRTVTVVTVAGDLELESSIGYFHVEGARLESFGPWVSLK